MKFPNRVQLFFEKRKISQKVLSDFQIGWNGTKIIYPVFDINGNKIFSNYRRDPASDIGPKYTYDKGSHISLYGIHKLQNQKDILILEGQNDVLAAWSAGIAAVTSTGGAASFQESWAPLFSDKNIIVCLDTDQAGHKGMEKILNILPSAKILLLPDKKGMKDICDFTTAGKDLHELLKLARHFNSLQEVKDDYADRIALMKPVWFHEAWMASHPEFPPEEKEISKRDGDDLARAKMYPLDRLLAFNRAHKAICPFHQDTVPSAHWYPKNNKLFCFSCGKSADAIDIFQIQNNCSFQEAVKFLSK